MPLVAFGYGLDKLVAAAGGGEIIIALLAEPDITLDPEITITVDEDGPVIETEPELVIEVE